MTSTILTPKSNFGSVFKQAFKRSIPHLISILVVNILTGIVALSLTITNYSSSLVEYIQYGKTEPIDLTTQAMIVLGVSCMFCGFFSLFISSSLFKEIYSKRACDFYFSMPIKRETYFTANYLYGALINVVALIIPISIYVIINKTANGNVFTFDNAYIAKVTLAVALALLAIYSAFIMCAVVSGKKIHYVLLSLICLFCPSIATSGIVLRLNDIWGYYTEGSLPNAISPQLNVLNSVFSYGTDMLKYFIIISIVEIVGMFAVGYYVFKTRKAEVAEVSLTGNIVPYFLLALFVLSGFMYANTLIDEIATVLVGIVFAVISGLLFSAIFYKKAFTKKTAITTAVVCIASVIFVGFVYLPSYDRYVKYVPSADEVEKVEIYNAYYDDLYGVTILSQFVNFDETDYEEKPAFTITSEEGIADAIKLHEKTVDDKTIEKSQSIIPSLLEAYLGDYTYYETYDYNIVYTLKDGSKVERTYSVVSTYVNNEFAELMRNKDVLVQNYPVYQSENLLFATLENYEYNVETEDAEYYDDSEVYMYDKLLSAEQSNDFIYHYMDDLIDADNNKLLYNLSYNSLGGFYFPASIEDFSEGISCVYFYYIDENASAEDIEKLKNMTAEEIIQGYYNYGAEDTPFAYVGSYSIEIYEYETHTKEYLQNLK